MRAKWLPLSLQIPRTRPIHLRILSPPFSAQSKESHSRMCPDLAIYRTIDLPFLPPPLLFHLISSSCALLLRSVRAPRLSVTLKQTSRITPLSLSRVAKSYRSTCLASYSGVVRDYRDGVLCISLFKHRVSLSTMSCGCSVNRSFVAPRGTMYHLHHLLHFFAGSVSLVYFTSLHCQQSSCFAYPRLRKEHKKYSKDNV